MSFKFYTINFIPIVALFRNFITLTTGYDTFIKIKLNLLA
jgi:hypothetical protein